MLDVKPTPTVQGLLVLWTAVLILLRAPGVMHPLTVHYSVEQSNFQMLGNKYMSLYVYVILAPLPRQRGKGKLGSQLVGGEEGQ